MFSSVKPALVRDAAVRGGETASWHRPGES